VGDEEVVILDLHLQDLVRRLLQPISKAVDVADERIG
jgi:hypothetical protein